MLIQSLLLIATMLIVGGALLTSTLVGAKAALHQAVIHKTETATSDATAQFGAWAQGYVKKYGTEAPWPTGMQPQGGPITENLCTGEITSGGASSGGGSSSSSPSGTSPAGNPSADASPAVGLSNGESSASPLSDGKSSTPGSPLGASPGGSSPNDWQAAGGAAPGSPMTGGACALMATAEWTVTGASATNAPSQNGVISTAQNLSVGLDEQRVSATLTVIIADATGKTVFANHSRQLTVRIFDAAPYVALTGTRDVSTEVGDTEASEGDTGGTQPQGEDISALQQPTESDPGAFIDTHITATIDCANSSANDNQSNPDADGNGVYFDRSQHGYGNLAWAFEAPCSPQYQIDTTDAPHDYEEPRGATYVTNAVSSKAWRKSDENISGYSK